MLCSPCLSPFERAVSQFYVEGQADSLPCAILPIGTRAKSNIYCLSMIIFNQIIIISIGIHEEERICSEGSDVGSIFYVITDTDNLTLVSGCRIKACYHYFRIGCLDSLPFSSRKNYFIVGKDAEVIYIEPVHICYIEVTDGNEAFLTCISAQVCSVLCIFP